jgi:rSAM/selenodomain-associated transferase 2
MVSVIIPTLNEENELPETLRRLKEAGPGCEVLVVDGGSSDGTMAIARNAGALCFSTPEPGRAMQMELGAECSTGSILLFLHADTWLPSGGIALIEKAMSAPLTVGGAFRRRFRSDSIFLKLIAPFTDVRNHFWGWHLGDQAMFIRRTVFLKLGGFQGMSAFEDLRLSRAMRARGKTVTLRPPVSSSARRFERLGPMRRTFADVWLTLDYLSRARKPGGVS